MAEVEAEAAHLRWQVSGGAKELATSVLRRNRPTAALRSQRNAVEPTDIETSFHRLRHDAVPHSCSGFGGATKPCGKLGNEPVPDAQRCRTLVMEDWDVLVHRSLHGANSTTY